MRIFELFEDADPITEIAAKIKQNCAPFLSQNLAAMKSGVKLFRGIGKTNYLTDAILTCKSPTNRRPRDTSYTFHHLMDMFLEEHFGHKYRSAATFATTLKKAAASYGMVYAIFPIGEYNICYSTKVGDLYNLFLLMNDEENLLVFGDDATSTADTKQYGMQFDTTDQVSGALANFMSGDVRDISGNDVTSEFTNYLYRTVFPSLGYTETKKIDVLGDSEGMVKCDQFYAILNQGNYVIGDNPVEQILNLL